MSNIIILTLMTVVLVISSALQVNAASNKRGSCPRPASSDVQVPEFCITECRADDDCPDAKKCCRNGCKATCQVPEGSKSGTCPVSKTKGPCVESCKSDFSCVGDLKCCSNGCGKSCLASVEKSKKKPESGPKHGHWWSKHGHRHHSHEHHNDGGMKKKSKSGACPKVARGKVGICLEGCSDDSSCEGNLKCCSNGCGRVCTKPVKKVKKPMHCPFIFGYKKVGKKMSCARDCTRNKDCSDAAKCCPTICGGFMCWEKKKSSGKFLE